MQALITHSGKVMPLDRINVNTDAIIPADYLKEISKTGFADGLFTYWRYLGKTRESDPKFVLNMPRYQGATVLLTRENFGCGSSREHAPWALYEYGFRVILATSFADIFYNNCFNVGLLPIQLPSSIIQALFDDVESEQGYTLTINLPTQCITTPVQQVIPFEIDPFRKEKLVQGSDAIALTLHLQDKIALYEARRRTATPFYEVAPST